MMFYLLVAFGVISVLLFGLYAHTGLFHNIQVTAEEPKGCSRVIIAYKYTICDVQAYSIFKDTKHILPTYRKICIHYERSRPGFGTKSAYAIGFILGQNGNVEDDLKLLMTDLGYKIYTFPVITHAVVTTFPYRSDLYIKLARARVAAVLSAYIQERKLCAHPTIEIYDNSNIEFLVPLHRQNDFYVPEAIACKLPR